MLADISSSIKAAVYDRVTSPLLTTFVITWSLWNYRLFFVLFSNKNIEDKFFYIDTVLYSTTCIGVSYFVILPLFSTIIFLLVYPYPARLSFRFWRYQQKLLREIRQKTEDETPLTVEEVSRLKIGYQKRSDELSREVYNQNAIIEGYRDRIKSLEEDKRSLITKIESIKNKLYQDYSLSNEELTNILNVGAFQLFYNPKKDAAVKKITFLQNGDIGEGKNNNEYKWVIRNHLLEIENNNNGIHSRFKYIQESNIWIHTNDSDTLSIKGQYLIPLIQ